MGAILIASLATVALAEAESDPYVYSGLGGYYGGHLGYTGLGHLGYGYGLGYAGHHLGYAGYRGLGSRGYAGYHRLGYYGGLGYYGKRSADAEADPYVYYGYGLGHLGYAGHHGYVYGKRSADAEPEAKADPYLLTVDSDTPDTDWDTTSFCWTSRIRIRTRIPRRILLRQVDYIKIFQ